MNPLSIAEFFGVDHEVDTLQEDEVADPGMNVGGWIALVVGAVILLLVLAALFPKLTTALAAYAANDTSGMGTIVQAVTPILIGAAVVLAFVAAFIHYRK